MELGMVTEEIYRPDIKTTLSAIKNYGFTQIQLNLLSMGEKLIIAEQFDLKFVHRIAEEAKKQFIKIAALNGTFNMAHPDFPQRQKGLMRLRELAKICRILDTSLITLCTGSRNQGDPFDLKNMWTYHPDNDTRQAWSDLCSTMEVALSYAEEYNFYLGIEPETTNVVNSPEKARNLINDMKSSRLKIIIDCANLFHENEIFNVQDVLKNAFNILGGDIILAHGKDLMAGSKIKFTSAGKGIINYDIFIELLNSFGYNGCMILHGFKNENEIPQSVTFIKKKLACYGY